MKPFDINDGSRPSKLDKGQALTGESEEPVDPTFQREVAEAAETLEAEEIAEVPKTLRAALKALDESDVMRAAFGDQVVEHYVHAGQWEQAEYDRRVTDWEVIRNFERA